MEKKKILILPGGLQIGGAERVAANISSYAPEGQFEFHYLVFDCNENVYGPEIEARGGTVLTWPLPGKSYGSYIKNLYKLMRQHRYEAVHSHTMFNSGINLAVAKAAGIPVRIAHSHTTRTERRVSALKRMYEQVMRQVIRLTATHCYACGVDAGKWLYGESTFEKRGEVLRNGIDTVAFRRSEESRNRIRQQYQLEDAFVIGHTGTLLQVKNQQFLIRLLPDILKRKPNGVLMLVGGDENGEMAGLQALARSCGVEKNVIFCGAVRNVQDYLSAFDVFAFPSLREGTPLALLEAQTNALPCIVSDAVPVDAFLTDLIHPLPLENGKAWVEAICGAERRNSDAYPEKIRQAGYDAKESYGRIYDTYMQKEEKKKAVVSLSFDDGRGDNTPVVEELLIPRGLASTLNITTGYIDGTCPPELCPSTKAPMKKEDVIRLGSSPQVEIAIHGDRHQNTPEDILACREKLLDWLELPEDYLFGFASPTSALHREIWETGAYAEVREKLLYLRDSYRLRSAKKLRILCRKMGRVIHLPLLYRIAYGDTPMGFREGKLVYSACVLRDTTFAQVRGLIEDCIRNGTSVTLMFHSIVKDDSGEDNWSWSEEKFRRLCDYLTEQRDAGVLEVCTTRELLEKLRS